jgi:hypothetical protein
MADSKFNEIPKDIFYGSLLAGNKAYSDGSTRR